MPQRTMICLHGFTPEQEQRIRESAPDWNIVFGRPKDISPTLFQEAEVICGWSHMLAQLSLTPETKLRWIQLWSSGADYMPFDLLESKGVMLTDACSVHPIPVAETVFAMLLAFSRKLHHAIRNQSNRNWDSEGTFTELRGKTIGIIGSGEIGTEIARLSEAFGMKVIGVRRSGKPAPHVSTMYTLAQLDEVLTSSDIVVNVLPLTEETTGLFNQEKFNTMKTGAWFINVGRGASVLTDALVHALQEGPLSCAGLDVFETEPLPSDHPLWTMDNVIITPHIGGATDQLKERVAELFIHNLQGYLTSGTPTRNVIDYSIKY